MFVDYQRSKQESVFTPKKRLDEVIGTNAENKTDLIVARKIAEKSNCSYIFGEGSREIFCRNYENHFKDYSEVIKALFQHILKNTRVQFIDYKADGRIAKRLNQGIQNRNNFKCKSIK